MANSTQDLQVPEGATAEFSTLPHGYPNPECQWWKNGAALPGATNLSLTLSNVRFADFGVYSMTASNAFETIQASASLDIGVFTQPGSVDVSFRPDGENSCRYNSLLAVLANNNLIVAPSLWRVRR